MRIKTNDLVKSGLFLALGLILPYIFHITGGMGGQILLPMHIPVLLCGFILGPDFGLIVGIITPILNTILTRMPPIYPTCIAMIFELATYGFLSGYLYINRKVNMFISLILAMLAGRFVSGLANYILLSMVGKQYVLGVFLTSSFVTPVWGIIIQIVLIPIILKAINKYKGMSA